eukprot:scaffold8930_cov95-Isochrysis_galbana.AAC.1
MIWRNDIRRRDARAGAPACRWVGRYRYRHGNACVCLSPPKPNKASGGMRRGTGAEAEGLFMIMIIKPPRQARGPRVGRNRGIDAPGSAPPTT